MLRNLKQLFISLCLLLSVFICGVAQAKTVVVNLTPRAKQAKKPVFVQVHKVATNSLSFALAWIVGAGNRFSGDFSATTNAPQILVPVSPTEMDPTFGIDGTYLHVFKSAWAIGANINWNPLRLSVPTSPATDSSATYSGQLNVSQFATNILAGGQIITSHFLKLRALLALGLLYYHTNNAQVDVGGSALLFHTYNGCGFLYGARLEAVLGGWVSGMHPILSVSYMRSTRITLVNVQSSVNSGRSFSLIDSPKFTESVLIFGLGAAFNT